MIKKGLEEIHKVGILHLDIKPSNLLLRFDENSDHGQIVIIDYDMCRFTHDRDSSFNGTPGLYSLVFLTYVFYVPFIIPLILYFICSKFNIEEIL